MRSIEIVRLALLAVSAALLTMQPGPVQAAGFMEPNAEYSADQYSGVRGKTIKSKIYHAPKKQRMDMEEGGRSQHTITRMDKKVFWIVMPEKKMYMERSLDVKSPEQGRDIKECDVTRKNSGKEMVNGVSTAKSFVEMKCPDGAGFSGDIWESKEGIIVKMDIVDKKEGKDHLTVELKNLKIGKLDPGIFEVPGDYRKTTMPSVSMPGMGRMTEPNDVSESPRNEQSEQPDQKEQGTYEKGIDAIKKFKGLFGR